MVDVYYDYIAKLNSGRYFENERKESITLNEALAALEQKKDSGSVETSMKNVIAAISERGLDAEVYLADRDVNQGTNSDKRIAIRWYAGGIPVQLHFAFDPLTCALGIYGGPDAKYPEESRKKMEELCSQINQSEAMFTFFLNPCWNRIMLRHSHIVRDNVLSSEQAGCYIDRAVSLINAWIPAFYALCGSSQAGMSPDVGTLRLCSEQPWNAVSMFTARELLEKKRRALNSSEQSALNILKYLHDTNWNGYMKCDRWDVKVYPGKENICIRVKKKVPKECPFEVRFDFNVQKDTVIMWIEWPEHCPSGIFGQAQELISDINAASSMFGLFMDEADGSIVLRDMFSVANAPLSMQQAEYYIDIAFGCCDEYLESLFCLFRRERPDFMKCLSHCRWRMHKDAVRILKAGEEKTDEERYSIIRKTVNVSGRDKEFTGILERVAGGDEYIIRILLPGTCRPGQRERLSRWLSRRNRALYPVFYDFDPESGVVICCSIKERDSEIFRNKDSSFIINAFDVCAEDYDMVLALMQKEAD